MKKYEPRKDPLTNEMFIPKRNNQKFANRGNQIKYNNNKKAKVKSHTAQKPAPKPIEFNPWKFNNKPLTASEKIDYFAGGFICCAIIVLCIVIIKDFRKGS